MSAEAAVKEDLSGTAGKGDKIKFSVERAVILKSLAHIQAVVERRTTIPVLSNVKLEAEGDAIRLTATDTEISITEKIRRKSKMRRTQLCQRKCFMKLSVNFPKARKWNSPAVRMTRWK